MKRLINSKPPAAMFDTDQLAATYQRLVWQTDTNEMPWWQGGLIKAARLVHAVIRDLLDSRLTLYAMSLVFTTLLSIVPLLAVSFSVLKAFGVHNQLEPLLLNFLQPLGAQSRYITDQVIGFVDNIQVGVLGALGIALLFYTTISLIQKVETAFNSIWHVAGSRTLAEQFSRYFSIIMIVPVLVFSALGVTASLTGTAIVRAIVAIEPFGRLYEFVTTLVPYFLIIGAFTFLYFFIPNTRVRPGAALTGGIAAGVLWQTVGWIFATFIANSTGYTAIYSGFAILIVLMIWVYWSSLILLVGASIAFYRQHPEYLVPRDKEYRLSDRTQEELALGIMALVGQRWYRQEPGWSTDELVEQLHLSIDAVQDMLQVLERGGRLSPTRRGLWLPARPMETTGLKEVLDIVRNACKGPRLTPHRSPEIQGAETIVEVVDRAVDEALQGRTLKDLVKDDARREAQRPAESCDTATERMARHAGAAVLFLLLSGCAYFRDGNGPDAVEAEPQTGIRYDVEIQGEGIDDSIRNTLLDASDAKQAISRPPASEFVLRRRAQADLPNIENGLKSLGYYEGIARYELRTVRDDNRTAPTTMDRLGDRVEDFFRGAPTILTYHVVLGPRYTLGSIQIAVTDPQNGFLAPRPEALKLEPGQPAAAQPVLDAHGALVSQAERSGHAFAKADKLEAVIDRDKKRMDVRLPVTTGPVVRMGEFTIVGADHVDPRFLRGRVLFRPGDRYDPEVMEKTRQSLVDTNLFSTVVVDQPDRLDATRRLPITYTVTERKPRSIGAGVGYATDEGPSVSLFWEHRNFRGAGEKLRSDFYFSPLRQELSANFVKPDFGARKQNLLAIAALKAEDTDAYESESIGAGVAIERPIGSDRVTGSLGIAYRLAKIKPRDEEEESFGLFSLPAAIKMDYSDNLLDPTQGWRLSLLATPYTDILNTGLSFLKTQAIATTYLRLTDSAKYILALRGNLGSIAGASRDDIPADERFYAGGGGSIRGYGYQLAGPLDDDDDPLGGRSLIELSAELRYRMSDTIGLVYFVDAGTVADSALPSLEEDLFVGTGIGLRYVTPIGPLRLDVGVPLDRRSDIDSIVQVYVSIGQAF